MLGYTLHQFRTYVQLAQQREQRELRNAIFAAAMGQADKKSIEKVLRELRAP